jgi:hypothetical protein
MHGHPRRRARRGAARRGAPRRAAARARRRARRRGRAGGRAGGEEARRACGDGRGGARGGGGGARRRVGGRALASSRRARCPLPTPAPGRRSLQPRAGRGGGPTRQRRDEVSAKHAGARGVGGQGRRTPRRGATAAAPGAAESPAAAPQPRGRGAAPGGPRPRAASARLPARLPGPQDAAARAAGARARGAPAHAPAGAGRGVRDAPGRCRGDGGGRKVPLAARHGARAALARRADLRLGVAGAPGLLGRFPNAVWRGDAARSALSRPSAICGDVFAIGRPQRPPPTATRRGRGRRGPLSPWRPCMGAPVAPHAAGPPPPARLIRAGGSRRCRRPRHPQGLQAVEKAPGGCYCKPGRPHCLAVRTLLGGARHRTPDWGGAQAAGRLGGHER